MTSKYYNVRTEVDGILFHSKKEAAYYSDLLFAKKSGELLYFLRQVGIHITPKRRYVVDFVEFWKNGEIRYVDVKGFKTPTYKLKKDMIEHLYPIKIIEA